MALAARRGFSIVGPKKNWRAGHFDQGFTDFRSSQCGRRRRPDGVPAQGAEGAQGRADGAPGTPEIGKALERVWAARAIAFSGGRVLYRIRRLALAPERLGPKESGGRPHRLSERGAVW